MVEQTMKGQMYAYHSTRSKQTKNKDLQGKGWEGPPPPHQVMHAGTEEQLKGEGGELATETKACLQ